MIIIKIYDVMGWTTVEVTLDSQTGQTVEAATWYGELDEADPVPGLVEVIRNAFMSIDGYAGEISDRLTG